MIFVTGGTGLIGSHLLVKLSQSEEAITAIYRNKSKIENVRRLFDYYLNDAGKKAFQKINWVACNILDVTRLGELMKGHRHVYHCAAIVSFKRRDFNKMMEINRYGTANVVNVALDLGIEKLCYVSSTAAVGNKDIDKTEEVTEEGKWIVTDQTSGYSLSKYSAEKEVWRGIEEGLNAVIVNPSIVFGAWDWNESSMVIFNTIRKGLRFYSPGTNAFVDARDVAEIMVKLTNSAISSERYLCVAENMPFKDLFTKIADELNVSPPKHPVSPTLMGLAWRLSVLWAVLTFSSPVITKSAAQSAFKTIKYSNDKVRKELDFTFIPIEQTIKNAILGRINTA